MKNICTVALMALLVACAPMRTEASPVAPVSMPSTSQIIPVSGIEVSSTSSPEPSKTKITITNLKTPSPAPIIAGCLEFIRPKNGAKLSSSGKIQVAWKSQPGAHLYVLSVISETGIREDSQTTATKFSRALMGTSKSGSYYWSVSAYDTNGDLICNPGFIRFSIKRGANDQQESTATGKTDQQSTAPGETDEQAPIIADGTNPQSLSAANQSPNAITAVIIPGSPAATPAHMSFIPAAPSFLHYECDRFMARGEVVDCPATATPKPLCVGFAEAFCVHNATATPNNDSLPFDSSLLRIFSHIDPTNERGTYVVPPASTDVIPTAVFATDTVSPESPPTDTASHGPLATEPPATEPLATEPPATVPPATNPAVTEPPPTDPPATEAPTVP